MPCFPGDRGAPQKTSYPKRKVSTAHTPTGEEPQLRASMSSDPQRVQGAERRWDSRDSQPPGEGERGLTGRMGGPQHQT